MNPSCPYCGNNPVPHRFYRYSESLNIFLTPLRQKLLYNPLSRFLKRAEWLSKFENYFLGLGEALGIISSRTDCKLCKVRRAQVLWEEAKMRGIEMRELLLFGKPVDSYVAEKLAQSFDVPPRRMTGAEIGRSEGRKSETKIIFSGLPRPAGYVNKWLDLMDDKWLFKKVMMENGLPVPMGGSCWTFGQAKKIFDAVDNSPCPLFGKEGERFP